MWARPVTDHFENKGLNGQANGYLEVFSRENMNISCIYVVSWKWYKRVPNAHKKPNANEDNDKSDQACYWPVNGDGIYRETLIRKKQRRKG